MLCFLTKCFFFADRRGGSNYRKDEINWRHGNQDAHEEVMRASAALENLQLDRKTRNMTSSWRYTPFEGFYPFSFEI